MKIKMLQRELKKRKIDFAIFYRMSEERNANLLYFSKYEGHGFLIVPKNKKPFLVVPKTELGLAKRTGLRVVQISKGGAFLKIKSILKRTKRIGIDEKNFSVYAYKQLKKVFNAKIVWISELCSRIREIKTKQEIIDYKIATMLTDFIFKKCIKNFKRFKKEEDVSEFLKKEAAKLGCLPSFSYIVASGKNSSFAHHEPSGKLRKGFCIIDFGIKYRNLCTDMTRTIYIGKTTKKEKSIYNIVLKAQENAINSLEHEKRFSDVYNIVIKNLGAYRNKFIHGLGHGIGFEIHEMPNIRADTKDKIREGMIFTIEPGVYFKNKFGIRIEDDVLITKKGPVVLTKSPKNLIVIN